MAAFDVSRFQELLLIPERMVIVLPGCGFSIQRTFIGITDWGSTNIGVNVKSMNTDSHIDTRGSLQRIGDSPYLKL
jgi:hypothetical protein